jgi:hypothetical protein
VWYVILVALHWQQQTKGADDRGHPPTKFKTACPPSHVEVTCPQTLSRLTYLVNLAPVAVVVVGCAMESVLALPVC